MALTFPRDLTTDLPWQDAPYRLPPIQEISRTANATQVRNLASPIWRASFTTGPILRERAERLESDLLSLRGALRTFLAHTPRRPRPRRYTEGSLAGSVHSIRSDRSALRVSGLAAGLALTSGDYLSVTKANGGRELLRLITGGTVSSNGLSPWVEVEPHIRPSVQVDDGVSMDHPLCEMRLEGEPDLPERVGGEWFRVAFSAMQVVR